MIANLTLHLLSSANSTIAGKSDWESCWIPITSFTQSRFEMIFSLQGGGAVAVVVVGNCSECGVGGCIIKLLWVSDMLGVGAEQSGASVTQ